MHLLLYACCLFATSLSSPSLGTFFGVPDWMGSPSVASDRTYGSPDATNATHRIDGDALKAVNAIFEGFAERCYFAKEGPSNVWDETVFGPTARFAVKRDFRFGLLAEQNLHPRFVWDPDTNRVANAGTRRFVEYGNIDLLAREIAWHEDLGALMYILRPNWRYYSDDYLWSSTIFDRLGLSQFPTFDWSPFASCGVTHDEWAHSALYWNNCADPRDGEFAWRHGGYSGVLAYHMIRDISWGEPELYPPGYDEPLYFPSVYTLTNTTEDVIGAPYAGLWETWTESRKRDVSLTQDDILEGYVPTPDGVYHEGANLLNFVHNVVRGEYADRSDVPATIHVSTRIGPPAGFARDYWEDGYSIAYLFADTVTVGTNDYHWGMYVNMYMINDFPDVEIDCKETEAVPVDISFDVYGPDIWDFPLTPPMNFKSSPPLPAHVITLEYAEPRSNSVCKVHGLYTNDTRRLVTDRVAGLGQCLGALDRTYAPMNATMPPVTNVTYTGEIYYESERRVAQINSWRDGVGYCGAGDDIVFLGFSEKTNRLYETYGGSAATSADRIIAACGPSSDGVGYGLADVVKVDGEDGDWRHDFHLTAEMADGLWDGVWVYNGASASLGVNSFTMTFSFMHLSSGEVVRFDSSGIPYPYCDVEFVATPYYVRSYSMKTSVGGVSFGAADDQILYPGSFERVKSAGLWSLASVMCAWGTAANPLYDFMLGRYDDYSPRPEIVYSATNAAYSSHANLRSAFGLRFDVALAKCLAMVCGRLGVTDIRDPFQVIPMSSGDVSFDGEIVFGSPLEREVREVPIVTLTVDRPSADVFEPRAIVREGGSFTFVHRDGTAEPAKWPLEVMNAHLSAAPLHWRDPDEPPSPNCVRRHGAAANAKMSGLSRVDWSWGALRLETTSTERNNQ